MKIGLIGDIHANLPALEAVLNRLSELGADLILNTGDFVGYGPFPDQVVRLIRQRYILSIRGNYDNKTLIVLKKKKKWEKTKREEKVFAFEWAFQQLSKENKKFLISLPEEIRLNLFQHKILLTHGSPVSEDEHLTQQTPLSRLKELANLADADLIICGHSHQPFSRQVGNTSFINPGSVGRPDDGDPRASFALLTLSNAQFDLKHFRINYDLDKILNEIIIQRLPPDFARMFQLGINLEDVKNIKSE